MIYVTGDTHGSCKNFKDGQKVFNSEITFSQKDYLIITGDFGLVWADGEKPWTTEDYQSVYDFYSRFPGKILFIDGNNDNNQALDRFEVQKWNGGNVHMMINPKTGKPEEKMIHLMRGEIFEIEGKTILAFGGADSWDARVSYARKEGINWWKREQPSYDEFVNAMENLKKHDYKVDYLISHDTNVDGVVNYYDWNLPFVTNRYLTAIVEITEFRQWFYDHHHQDVSYGKHDTIANEKFYLLTDENYPDFKPREVVNATPTRYLVDEMNAQYRFVDDNYIYDGNDNIPPRFLKDRDIV